MSALFDIIIGFITALVSAAFLHFGAGGAPTEPAKPAPASQSQTTTTTETTVTVETSTADEAKPEAITLATKAPRVDPAHQVQVKVRVPVNVAHVDSKTPAAPLDMLAAPPAPPAPPVPPVAMPALPAPAIHLRISGLSRDEVERIAAEVESDLRAAELEIALEIAAQQDEIRAAAVQAARIAEHRIDASEVSGPCPDAQAAPLPAHIRTIVAQ